MSKERVRERSWLRHWPWAVVLLLACGCGGLIWLGLVFKRSVQISRDSTNMTAIYHTMSIYADQHDGALPPARSDWKQLLIDTGEVAERSFRSGGLRDTQATPTWYFYVPAPALDERAERTLVYTNPRIHGGSGALCLRHDGTQVFLNRRELEAMLSMIVLPDGTPYVPHPDER